MTRRSEATEVAAGRAKGPGTPAPRRAEPRKGRVHSGVLEASTLPSDAASTRAAIRTGDACLRGGDPEQAARHYAIALTALKSTGHKSLLAGVYLRLGHANRALGRTLPAVQSYRAALEMDPGHAPTLEALVSLHLAWEEWEYVLRYEERLFHALADDSSLHDVMLRSGDRWWRLAGDVERAQLRYMVAQRRFPHSRRAAQRLLAASEALARPTGALRGGRTESGTFARHRSRPEIDRRRVG